MLGHEAIFETESRYAHKKLVHLLYVDFGKRLELIHLFIC